MNWSIVLPSVLAICSLAVAGASLRTARKGGYAAEIGEYVDSLEHTVDELKGDNIDLRRQLEECKEGRQELQQQNFYLLQEMHELRKKVVE